MELVREERLQRVEEHDLRCRSFHNPSRRKSWLEKIVSGFTDVFANLIRELVKYFRPGVFG
jgi:hypothetical protein